jgi:D-alanine--poly(phosphoribitol) ligase subunit 2
MKHEAIQPFVLALLGRKGALPAGFDEATDYIAAGIIDSIGIIKFVLELESHFGIEIGPQDIESAAFRTVRGLTNLITCKRLH